MKKRYREIGLNIIEQTFKIIFKVLFGSKKNLNIHIDQKVIWKEEYL